MSFHVPVMYLTPIYQVILLVRSQSKILQKNKVIDLTARSHSKILQQNDKQDLACQISEQDLTAK